MRTEYFIVLGAILFFPLLLSVVMRLGMYRHAGPLLKAMGIVSILYWAWDVAVTARGHWSFNPDYVVGFPILGMPVEEWLFFVVLTFVSIFTYEAVRKMLERK
jgi:lycopene cyclase domain-containing protein